jgi:hypothetical protein
MIYTTISQKVVDAINANGLHTDTSGIGFPTGTAIEQAPSGKAIATEMARLTPAGQVVQKSSAGDFRVFEALSRKLEVSK